MIDIVSFEVPAGFEVVEGAANVGGTIVTSPAPFPTTESNCLRLPPGVSSLWKGNVSSFTPGDAFEVLFMIRFAKAGGVPFVNDIPFLALYDGVNEHFSLNLVENGGVNDLQLRDTAGAVCTTIPGQVFITDRWYYVRLLVKLQDADTPSGGVGGACELQIISTTPPNYNILFSASCSNEDFKTTGNNVGMRFKSEGGTPPAQPTAVYIGSALMFSGLTTPLDTSEFHPRFYTCFGASPTKASATPDCDSAGADPGSKDNLDDGTTWDKAGDGATGLGNRATYGTFDDEGAVKVDHPGSDSRVNAGLTRYGMAWVWLKTYVIRAIYGKETSGGYTVTDVATTGITHKVVEDDGGSYIPDLDKDAVIGFIHKKLRGGAAHLEEAWCISAFKYPLVAREVGPPVFAGRTGRIVS